nr:hypothetical protein [Armatimonadota bacterium]
MQNITNVVLAILALFSIAAVTAQAQTAVPREQTFNTGWKFLRLDDAAQNAASYEGVGVNDAVWD